MPARSVVIERFTKYGGAGRATLTSGEYLQLTGRAGRRGLDEEGHAVVEWSTETTFAEAARVASAPPPDLRSAFRPTYNLAVNLVSRFDRETVTPNERRADYQCRHVLLLLMKKVDPCLFQGDGRWHRKFLTAHSILPCLRMESSHSVEQVTGRSIYSLDWSLGQRVCQQISNCFCHPPLSFLKELIRRNALGCIAAFESTANTKHRFAPDPGRLE